VLVYQISTHWEGFYSWNSVPRVSRPINRQ